MPEKNTDYAPGMRVIIRDEEWVIRKEKSEDMEIANTANVKLIADNIKATNRYLKDQSVA